MENFYTRPSSVAFEGCDQATAVAYDKDGRTYDIHHWRSSRWAALHVKFLNDGMSREAALLAVYDSAE